MRVLFVTPELSPYSGVTPMGEASWALPKALEGLGHEVTVLSPLYGFVDPMKHTLARRLRKVEVTLGEGPLAFTVFDTRSAAGVDLQFLGQEQLLGPVTEVPLEGTRAGDGLLFGAFAKAAVEVLRTAQPAFDRVICVDWQTALVPLLLELAEVTTPSVLCVSDVRRQGRFDRSLLGELGLPASLFNVEQLEFYGKVCFLKGGAVSAGRVTTVSPSYADEVVQYANGLEGVFKARGKELSGIAGGIDTAVWNPATDPHLTARFDPMDLSGKRRDKAALQKELGFPIRDDVALMAVLGPISPDSGLDVLARIVGRLMRNDVQVAVLAEGGASDAALATVLAEHARRWPDRLHVRAEADAPAVHRALSGADLVMVPPSQAPGGATQLRAHRYGALPIGLRAGAFGDTVVDCDAKLTTGTGFAYDEASDEAILATLQRAIAGYAERSLFERARARALRSDHGWERAAYLYERLLRSLD
ncbi:MAG: glycogen synthase [Sandaracinaceae bacterium]|nr:glycogen synthase [Sandaracinaceae bacterium]